MKIDLKNNQWLIVTDLDGTFLSDTPNFSIHSKNVKAVRELNKLGHKFMFASGRSPHLMEFNHHFLELDTPMVCFHGANIYDPSGKNKDLELIKNGIEPEIIKKLLLDLNFFDRARSIHIIGENKSIEFSDIEDLDLIDFTVYELVTITEADQEIDYEEIIKLLEEKYLEYVSFKLVPAGSGHNENLLLFVAKGTDKVNALIKISEYYGIPQERVMYFGDNFNDIEAIKWAGVGVCVESGKEDVKNIADYVAKGNNHQGAVGRFILDLLK